MNKFEKIKNLITKPKYIIITVASVLVIAGAIITAMALIPNEKAEEDNEIVLSEKTGTEYTQIDTYMYVLDDGYLVASEDDTKNDIAILKDTLVHVIGINEETGWYKIEYKEENQEPGIFYIKTSKLTDKNSKGEYAENPEKLNDDVEVISETEKTNNTPAPEVNKNSNSPSDINEQKTGKRILLPGDPAYAAKHMYVEDDIFNVYTNNPQYYEPEYGYRYVREVLRPLFLGTITEEQAFNKMDELLLQYPLAYSNIKHESTEYEEYRWVYDTYQNLNYIPIPDDIYSWDSWRKTTLDNWESSGAREHEYYANPDDETIYIINYDTGWVEQHGMSIYWTQHDIMH